MEEIEIPKYFICPISLQMMRDPVTAVTGITYDRESIEKWLRSAKDSTCPVTKQPLPRDSGLTPNHTLRRLIQAWCTDNATHGVDRIPTPRSPLDKNRVFKLIRDLGAADDDLNASALKKLEALAKESEGNRKCMNEAGVPKALVLLITRRYKEGKIKTIGLEEALRILHLIWSIDPSNETFKVLVKENYDLIDALRWILRCDGTDDINNHVAVKTTAMLVLKLAIQVANARLLEGLKPEFFKEIVRILRKKISQQATKSALQILIEACPWGRNRMKIVEANAVFELIELELEKPEKSITELIFNLLAHLCSCAEGREKLLGHAGSIAMVAKRTLRVSPATDDRAIHILSLISRYSAKDEVLLEMLRVGAVSKICMVIQADCPSYLKLKARGILRSHLNVWNNSPCIAVYLLTRYQR